MLGLFNFLSLPETAFSIMTVMQDSILSQLDVYLYLNCLMPTCFTDLADRAEIIKKQKNLSAGFAITHSMPQQKKLS